MRRGHRGRMNAASHQASEMSHVDDKKGANLICDLPHAGEVDDSGVGAASGNDEFGLFLLGNRLELVVVDPLRLFLHAIKRRSVEFAGEAQLMPVSQMASMGQVKTQDGVARVDDSHVGGCVGLRTGVGLHVCVLSAKELFSAVSR
jgi:hypothetical protein